jgi:NAD(P)-dependent dehydrogenase (short-subunit alcohol dehydrogenase family)
MSFSNQVIWITGASSGIGRQLALAFAQDGAWVAVSARRTDLLEELVNEISLAGGKASAFYCDVTCEESIEECVAAIEQLWGRVDVAIANAGFGVVGAVEKLAMEDWTRQFSANVTGLALTAKHAIPHLRKTNGRLVLVGSVSAFIPNPGAGAYGASKAAVHSIGETLQVELAGTGISCTTIHPGFVDSNIARVDNKGHFHPDRKDNRPARLRWPTERAARVMLKAIQKRKKVLVFTMHGKIGVFMGKYFPGITRKFMEKSLKGLI